MGEDNDKRSSKHKRNRDKDSEEKKKRTKSSHGQRKKRKGSERDALHITDDDPSDDMWVEKNIDLDGERVLDTDIPTVESLKLTSRAQASEADPPLPPALVTESKLNRDDWMLEPIPSGSKSSRPLAPQFPTADDSLTDGYGELSESGRTLGGAVDFFSSLGTEKKRNKPEKQSIDEPKISSRELNPELRAGRQGVQEVARSSPPPKSIAPGGPGSSWRMMRLRRVFEAAQEENRPVEEVAIERFGTMQAFEEAKEERRILDEREGRSSARGGQKSKGKARDVKEERFTFTDMGVSGGSSRSSSFRRPGSASDTPAISSPAPQNPPASRQFDSLRLPSQAASPLQQSHTPIPTVMAPSVAAAPTGRSLSPSSLNKLQAKVLRAKLMNAPNADQLEREYEEELRRANGEPGEPTVRTKVEVLPTLDARGRLYDVGGGEKDATPPPGNRKKKEKFETRDPKTGEIVRYNADDDTITLREMLRQERFEAGITDQKNLDAQFAKAIMGDSKFENDLDYIDDNAERLGRQKMRSDAMKRQFAIHDYKRTQKVLATSPVIAMGTRAYLSCTLTEELLEGHCLISMLEADDDVWDEVRNFMKSIMKMFAEEDKGVVFYETVINLKWQKHTFIECVPLPWEQYDYIPQYFKESILTSETEWSQHKKLIDFSKRPGGFRRAMVPNLPYFMVQFDYKGERGYGHVIEGTDESAAAGEEDGAVDEGDKGGGEFPRYFAGEIIGNVMDVEPRRWRRPRRMDFRFNMDRRAQFRKKYDKFDWTGMIGK
ncbi:CwfJ C-terminus 2-domain-containing protein-like protein [Pisolithus croceorrhizus]|nr:CwfJ C-terminus 2-domain-containing protein-like protein [Pisolithus croceorrhizus]